MRLFITGGTGLVGRRLVQAALDNGHEVMVLSRSAQRAAGVLPVSAKVVEGDPMRAGAWQDQAAHCDGIVHLAGENLFARRWTAEFKTALRRSRIETTRRVVEVFERTSPLSAGWHGSASSRNSKELGDVADPSDDARGFGHGPGTLREDGSGTVPPTAPGLATGSPSVDPCHPTSTGDDPSKRRARVLVNASAVGYYGHSEVVTFREDSPRGRGFLADLCGDWEAEAVRACEHGARVVLLRTGVVLDPGGGALGQMLPVFRWFLGGPLGTGRQYLSWIHLDDMVNLILHALRAEMLSGPVNATAPHPVTNREFSQTLSRLLRRPSFLRTPGFAVRWALGEVGDLVLKGQRVLPAKAEVSGFVFRFPYLEDALRDLLTRSPFGGVSSHGANPD